MVDIAVGVAVGVTTSIYLILHGQNYIKLNISEISCIFEVPLFRAKLSTMSLVQFFFA